jgi:CspA family cold shock protein
MASVRGQLIAIRAGNVQGVVAQTSAGRQGRDRTRGEPMKIQGKVKFFDSRKQFGFIAPADGGEDVFFGRKSLPYNCAIDKDTVVKFELGQDRQGRTVAATVEPA